MQCLCISSRRLFDILFFVVQNKRHSLDRHRRRKGEKNLSLIITFTILKVLRSQSSHNFSFSWSELQFLWIFQVYAVMDFEDFDRMFSAYQRKEVWLRPLKELPYFKGVLFLFTQKPCNKLLELLEHEILEIQSVVQKWGRSNSGVSIQPIIIVLNLPFKESELIIDTAVL